MRQRLVLIIALFVTLVGGGGADAQITATDNPESGFFAVGDTERAIDFGDSEIRRNSVFIDAHKPSKNGAGEIVASADVDIDPSGGGCCRGYQVALGKLVTGSTYTIVDEFTKTGIQANDDTGLVLKKTPGVPCVPGTYATVIVEKNQSESYVSDRSANTSIHCAV